MEKEIQGSCQNLREETIFSTEILDKLKKSADNNFSKVLYNHLSLFLKYLKLLEKNGPEVFPNRFVYERFQVAKLVIDKISLLEFSVDPSLEELQEYKGMRSPPIETFNMTSDVKEVRKIKFCQNVDKGDILHLRVVEECETEYKLQVINKYNENERAVDYVIYAYMMKSYQLEKLPRPLQISDFVRAAVLGKLRIKENVFSKLLVTLNCNLVNEKYKNVSLGLVTVSEIPFYPEDLNFNSYLDYMKAYRSLDDDDDDPQKIKCITSLGVDPYKIYSFHKHHDGGKFGKSEKINHWTMEKKKSDLSSKLVKEAEKRIVQDSDYKSGQLLLEQALEIYPGSDVAYAMRGQLYKQLFLSEKNPTYLKKSLDDFQKSLDINEYNVIVVREYLTLLLFSTELFIEEGDEAKFNEIMSIISKYKDIYDASRLLSDDNLEEEMDSALEQTIS